MDNNKSLGFSFPAVAKQIRGRGSHGAKVYRIAEQLSNHALSFFGRVPVDYARGEPFWRGSSRNSDATKFHY